jgi:hypothetical protein
MRQVSCNTDRRQLVAVNRPKNTLLNENGVRYTKDAIRICTKVTVGAPHPHTVSASEA